MFEILDQRRSLTGNQIRILVAAIFGDALEFFDYFLIGFVLAFLIGPWKLTFGQSATVLMSSGVGAILGAYAWGWLPGCLRPPRRLHRHRPEFLHRHRPALFHPRQWLGLPDDHALLRRYRRRRALL